MDFGSHKHKHCINTPPASNTYLSTKSNSQPHLFHIPRTSQDPPLQRLNLSIKNDEHQKKHDVEGLYPQNQTSQSHPFMVCHSDAVFGTLCFAESKQKQSEAIGSDSERCMK